MELLIPLLIICAVAWISGLIWRRLVRREPWGVALHRSAVFGMVVMLTVFIALIIADFLDWRPGDGAG